jgi:hypothetical protein
MSLWAGGGGGGGGGGGDDDDDEKGLNFDLVHSNVGHYSLFLRQNES